MRANVMPGPSSAELNGLNWQVHVDPLTLSMTSLPPTLPVPPTFAGVPELAEVPEVFELFEPPPQALITTHTDANNASHLKRFIATLSFAPRRRFADTSIWKSPKQKHYIRVDHRVSSMEMLFQFPWVETARRLARSLRHRDAVSVRI